MGKVITDLTMSLDGFIAGPNQIQLHIMPILLGDGVRLLDHLGNTPIPMETVEVRPDGQVTHMRYRIVK